MNSIEKIKEEIFEKFRNDLLIPFKFYDEATRKHGGEVQRAQVTEMWDAISLIDPKKILEIGFNRGASSLAFLFTDIDEIISCDSDGCNQNVIILKSIFKNRFNYAHCPSRDLLRNTAYYDYFDFAFIDGDHSYEYVHDDILICKNLRIGYLLFDDYLNGADEATGKISEVRKAIETSPNLEIVRLYKTLPGLALVKDKEIIK